MKETVITSRMKRRELLILLSCFSAAFLMNIIGIILYHAPLIELLTKLHIVLLITVLIYGAVGILRALYYLLSRLWIREK